ncbi:hypothetical protein BGZ74_003929 [Mortierella antarctica]|nr:hypothetical protein BGZ74_003929 [Mortierella antarctica]
MSSIPNSSPKAKSRPDTEDSPPPKPPILIIPFEVLGEIVPYLVAANTISDLFHLSQTCKDLHASVWDPASDIWRVVWSSLYDDLKLTDATALTTSDVSSAIVWDKYQYKHHLRRRLHVFRDVGVVAQALRDDIVIWESIAYGYTHGTNQPKPGQKQPEHEDIAETVMDIIDIAAEHVSRNMYWIRTLVASEVWAFSIYLLYRLADEAWMLARCPTLGKPATLCRFYLVLAQVCATDPYALEAIYRDKYESFKYLRGSVFRREDGCSFGRLAVDQIPRLWYPWSICQIMYMVLFCGPSVMYYVDKEQEKARGGGGGDGSGKKRKVATSADWVPSWFNFGVNGHLITPVPLTIPPSIKTQQSQQQHRLFTGLAGSWTGYYAYSDEESADLMALQRTTGPEFGCRGIALDARMKLAIVDWTTDSCVATSSSSPTVSRKILHQAANRGAQPLYLRSDLDAQAFKLVDRYFMPFRQPPTKSAKEEQVSSMDDLEDKAQWQHQRIFSGRGTDIFGEYGVRGILSEQSGLVRMVKHYFRHFGGVAAVPSPEEAAAALQWEDEPWKAYLEFGTHGDQMKFLLNTGPSVWYYRGQLMPQDQEGETMGRGIQGLWFTDVDSGPFWIYNTDVRSKRTRSPLI